MKHFKTAGHLAACARLSALPLAAAEAKARRPRVPLRARLAQVERRMGRPGPRDRRYHLRTESALANYAHAGGRAEGPSGPCRRARC